MTRYSNHSTDLMGERLTMPKMTLLLAEVVLFALLAVVATTHFGMRDGACITVSYLVAYLIPRAVLDRARGTSVTAAVILFVLSALLIGVSYFNLLDWTSADGYSLEIPNLKSDAREFYKWALNHYDGRVEAGRIVFPGFPLMMVGLWKMLGLSVVWPQAMNMMFTLMAVVLTGMTTRRLLVDRVSASDRTLLSGGMLINCLLFYYLMSGISILKEPSVYLAIAMAGFALTSMATSDENRHQLYRDILIFALACVILAFVRTTYLYFVAVGVIIMTLPHWRRDWMMSLCMFAIVLVTLLIGNYFASYSFERHAIIIDSGWSMQQEYVDGSNKSVFRRLIGYYFLYSPWHKILMLPITLSLQFLIPFPWLPTNEETQLFNITTRISYGWYAVGGIALFYYLFMSWRKEKQLEMWPWWPAISFAVIAYLVAGSVTRYTLPFQPLFIPVVLFVLCRLHEGFHRKAFTRWSILFIILLTVSLLVCLEIQYSTISNMLNTQSLVQILKSLQLPNL